MKHLKFSLHGKVIEATAAEISQWMSPDAKGQKPSIEDIDLDDRAQYEAVVDLIFEKRGRSFWTQKEVNWLATVSHAEYNAHITLS